MDAEHRKKEWDRNTRANFLYMEIIDVLIGHDVDIAILALNKCIWNLKLCDEDIGKDE